MKARFVSPVRFWASAMACALSLVTGAAQAAVYTGVWDPVYGAPFTNLGWRGTATFAVPDGCEPSGTADISNGLDCGGAASLTSAAVEFYDASSTGQATLDTLTFNPASMLIGTLRYVSGNLDQLTTSTSSAVYASANLSAFGVAPTVGFLLHFDLGGPRLAWLDCSNQQIECLRGTNSVTPQFSITRVPVSVPEPGSLWLAGLAVVAWVAVRRAAVKTGS
jgi:hypothetical protein